MSATAEEEGARMPGLEKQKLLERLEGAGGNAQSILRGAPEELRGDKDVALAAVAQSGGALHYASMRRYYRTMAFLATWDCRTRRMCWLITFPTLVRS